MKKIAIIEFSYHIVYLSTVVRAVRELGFYPVVFVNETVHKNFSKDANLGDPDVELVVVDFSNSAQLTNSQQLLKHCNAILINTISPWIFSLIGKEDFNRCIVTVHNALYETQPAFSLSPRLIVSRLIELARHLCGRLLTGFNQPYRLTDHVTISQRRLLLSQAQSILVFHQNMIDPIVKRTSIPAERLRTVPFNLPTNDDSFLTLPNSPKEVGCLSLAIIGGISYKRKSYEQALTSLMEFNNHFPVKITIIGKFASESAKNRLTKLLTRTNLEARIVGGSRRASTEEVLTALKSTHLILGIQPQYMNVSCFKESYGYTKASGAEFDALNYNRLLLRPWHIPATRGMEGLSLCYNDKKGFTSILRSILDSDTYKRKYKEFMSARNSALYYLGSELRSALIPKL